MSGPAYLLRGLALWRTRPRLMLLGVVPALLVLLVLLGALAALLWRVTDLAAWATPFADDWADPWQPLVRLLLAVVVVVGAVLLSTVVFTGLTLAVGDPFYERIWAAVEEQLGDAPGGNGPPWWRSARDGLVLAASGLLVGLLLLVVGLVPVVGTLTALLVGLALGGRLLAAELLARPLEARGLDRHARRELLRRRRTTVWGFGLVTQACFLVPLGAVVVMPAAVAGATMLARDLLAPPPPRPPPPGHPTAEMTLPPGPDDARDAST